MLKNTQKWNSHQRIPTKGLQQVSKSEKHEKVKMMTQFRGFSEDRPKKRGRKRNLQSGPTVGPQTTYGCGIRLF